MPLTIENLVAECENITALKMDSTGMEECQDIHAVQKRKIKCYNYGGPHYRSICRFYPPRLVRRCGRSPNENDPTAARETIVKRLPDSPQRTLPARHRRGYHVDITSKRQGSPALESCALLVKTADGSPMKIGGRFSTDFSVKDRTTGSTIQGNGLCFITESANSLIGVVCPASIVPAAESEVPLPLGGRRRIETG
ncbi:hypothetical protein OESDEN_12545 [Oesophagostomum dentatum]|uniref:Uncharacterized protein n=1 Tax=Oesophagostomum dentatum TaxID=61180 RepID=A0A0B1SX00_OESDE|nr:hypothetical protein OESDEN_12545 [Oesophagostomum dentatum]